MPDRLILALDFGGTKLTAGVGELRERSWHGRRSVFSQPRADAGDDMATMLGLARDLLTGKDVAAAGVSFGGPVDFEQGMVRLSHHVPGWENVPLKELLERELDLPVIVDNDANAAALGEFMVGAGGGVRSLFYLTVSTGVGGGWILDGRPWRGATGMAGEAGHMVVDPDGPVCLCGKRGCVERLASGPYMASDYARETGEAVTGKDVAERAAAGDEVAVQLLRRSAWALGVAIGNTANLMNPELFLLGGGVTKAGEDWWDHLRKTADETAMPEVRGTFRVRPAAFRDEAPLWGAVCLGELLCGAA